MFFLALILYLYSESAFVEVKVRISLLWWTIRGSNEMFRVENIEKWRVSASLRVDDTQKDTQNVLCLHFIYVRVNIGKNYKNTEDYVDIMEHMIYIIVKLGKI